MLLRLAGLGLCAVVCFALQAWTLCSSGSETSSLTIASQSEADVLQDCDTFRGGLTIALQNGSTPISLDGIRHLTGYLFLVNGFYSNHSLSALSMKSLVSIGDNLNVFVANDLQNLNFPALSTIGGGLILNSLPSLSEVQFPSLTATGYMLLNKLPSLQRLSFDSGLSQVTGINNTVLGAVARIDITATSLRSIEGLTCPSLSGLTITDNPLLDNITLSLQSMVCSSSSRYPYDQPILKILGNNRTFVNLPILEYLACETRMIDVAGINIPRLTYINGSFSVYTTTMRTFSAPNLLRQWTKTFYGGLQFSSTGLVEIDLPVLHELYYLLVDAYPVSSIENGISLPNLVTAESISIYSTKDNYPYCQIFNNYRCRGLIKDYYICGDERVDIASDANQCKYTYPMYGWTLVKKLCIGLVLPLCVLAMIGTTYWCYRRRRNSRALRDSEPHESNEIELSDELPKYQRHDGAGGDLVLPPYGIDHDHPPTTCTSTEVASTPTN